jgi:GT2 family glycosyltransferase
MTAPMISIIVPAYNREALIGNCIASLRGCYRGKFELIIVDDGSTDGTPEAAARAIEAHGLTDCARIIQQPNAGAATARNTGAHAAQGQWLAFIDSDDLWFEWTLQSIADRIAKTEAPTLFFLASIDFEPDWHAGMTPQRHPPAERSFPTMSAAIRSSIADGKWIRCGSVFALPSAAFNEVGGFDPAVRSSEDLDFFLRGDGHWCVTLLESPVLWAYCLNSGNNISGNAELLREGLQRMLRNEREGVYPPGPFADPDRMALHARGVVYTARIALANGRADIAYDVLLRHGALVMRYLGIIPWLRVALTPGLHLVKPRSFPFRLRPRHA